MNTISIVCLSSEYCSRGRFIAMDFAKKSGFTYYDDHALCALLEDKTLFGDLHELDEKLKTPEIYDSITQEILAIHERLEPAILKASELGPCIIHERAAMAVLNQNEGLFSVMIQANDFEQKLLYAHIDPKVNPIQTKVDFIKEEDRPWVTNYIHNQDHIRRHYHDALVPMPWGGRTTYDLILNSDRLSVEQCGDLLKAAVELSGLYVYTSLQSAF